MSGELLTGLGALGTGLGALGSIGTGLLNYSNSVANLDYQKSLQQQIFNREDTSLQRRMADAQAAGLNPYSVINSGGANSGNVVKTDAPQVQGMNFNGLFDTVKSILDIQQGVAETKRAKVQAENEVKTGLILDADLIGKDWQNKMYGQDYDLSKFNKYNAFLGTLRNMADFNFDFNTDFRFKSDGDEWNIEKMYGNSRLGDIYFGLNPNTTYGKSRMNDYYYNEYMRKLGWYSQAEADYYYNNWMDKDYSNRYSMQDTQRALLEKENSWYNWNQGFNVASNVIDDVTGILFKKLDFGLKKAMNGSHFRNYYGR